MALNTLIFGRVMMFASALILTISIAARAADDQPLASPSAFADLRRLYSGPPSEWPRPFLEPGAAFTEFGPIPDPPGDAGNAAQIALGQRLFEDPRLSRSGQIACATCHNAEMGFTDGLRTSFGHDRKRGRRNAPPLFAVAWVHDYFWDGRERSLESQVAAPVSDPLEMASDRRRIERWINRDPTYRGDFKALNGQRKITLADIASMIAVYERSLKPPRNRWDRVFTNGIGALSDEQLWGLHLFRTKAGCANCHSGPLLTDERFHNLGLSFYGTAREDLGRYAVTGRQEDVGAFRTPTLRGLIYTRPYMHNGFFPFLEPVLLFYASGGRNESQIEQADATAAPPPIPDPLLKPRPLTREERDALVAFLQAL